MFLSRIRAAARGTLIAAVAALAAPAHADQDDPRLEALFERLATTREADVADALEAQIWRIWLESGAPAIDALLARGIDAMEHHRLDDAIALFGEVTERAPGFAEGWNKRATAYFLRGDLESSVLDIERTLALEPRHFGAMSGMGLIFMRRGDAVGALGAFEAVLRIHPNARGARSNAEQLRRALRDRRVRRGQDRFDFSLNFEKYAITL